MNMQAMLQKAQKMQKEMMKAQDEINNTIYEGSSSIVSVKIKGTKEVIEVNIEADELEKDDLEMLQDMIVVALNDAFNKIDKDTEAKLGKYTQGMPGLF